MLTNVRSLSSSLNQVIPIPMPMAVDGMVRRLVLNLDYVRTKVLKLDRKRGTYGIKSQLAKSKR